MAYDIIGLKKDNKTRTWTGISNLQNVLSILRINLDDKKINYFFIKKVED